MEGLINRLKQDSSIDKVYFDKNGGWLFVPNKHHTIIKTREEVLAGVNKAEKATEKTLDKPTKKDEDSDKDKKKN